MTLAWRSCPIGRHRRDQIRSTRGQGGQTALISLSGPIGEAGLVGGPSRLDGMRSMDLASAAARMPCCSATEIATLASSKSHLAAVLGTRERERDASSRQPAGSNPIVAVNRVWPISRLYLSAARAGPAAAEATLGEPGDRYCLPRQDGGDGLGDRGFTGGVAARQEGDGRALKINALRPSKITNSNRDHATAFCDIWRSARAFLRPPQEGHSRSNRIHVLEAWRPWPVL